MDHKPTSALSMTCVSFSIQETPETKIDIYHFTVMLSGTILWRI